MENDTKVTSKMMQNQDKENTFMRMEIVMRVSGKMICTMAMV
jgi:hypothetical protein